MNIVCHLESNVADKVIFVPSPIEDFKYPALIILESGSNDIKLDPITYTIANSENDIRSINGVYGQIICIFADKSIMSYNAVTSLFQPVTFYDITDVTRMLSLKH